MPEVFVLDMNIFLCQKAQMQTLDWKLFGPFVLLLFVFEESWFIKRIIENKKLKVIKNWRKIRQILV